MNLEDFKASCTQLSLAELTELTLKLRMARRTPRKPSAAPKPKAVKATSTPKSKALKSLETLAPDVLANLIEKLRPLSPEVRLTLCTSLGIPVPDGLDEEAPTPAKTA